MAGLMKAEEIVDQSLGPADAMACPTCSYSKIRAAKGAEPLTKEAGLCERRDAGAACGAAVAEEGAMPEACHTGGQRPCAMEIRVLILSQAHRAVLKPERRLNLGPVGAWHRKKWQAHSGQRIGTEGERGEDVARHGCMRHQRFEDIGCQASIQSGRPVHRATSDHRPEMSRRYAIGMRDAMEPARQEFAGLRKDSDWPAMSGNKGVSVA
jgi:hypothetical protein